MTQSASVDRDQLAVLRRLREQLGADQVEVIAVLDLGSADWLNAQTRLAQETAGIAPAPVAASVLERTHYQGSLIDRPPAWTEPGHPGSCPFCGSTHVRWTWKPDGAPKTESVRCFGCGWVETRPYMARSNRDHL
jgi:hypothetical protein